MFTQAELDLLNQALDMSLASNRRMQVSKPQFSQIFRQIDSDLHTLKNKINNINTQATPVAKK